MDYEEMIQRMLDALGKQQDRADARTVFVQAVRLYLQDTSPDGKGPTLKEATRAAVEGLREAQVRVSLG